MMRAVDEKLMINEFLIIIITKHSHEQFTECKQAYNCNGPQSQLLICHTISITITYTLIPGGDADTAWGQGYSLFPQLTYKIRLLGGGLGGLFKLFAPASMGLCLMSHASFYTAITETDTKQ